MHVIRLRGPWQLSVDDQQPTTIKLPRDNWLDPVQNAARSIRLARQFHRPTGIESKQVFLAIQFQPLPATVSLNDRQLGQLRPDHPPLRIRITDYLADQNRLTVDVSQPLTIKPQGDAICHVQLEIEEDSEC